MKALLDTNVLIDVLAKREPFFEASADVWRRCETEELEGMVAAITFDNLHYIMRKLVGADLARSALRQMRDLFTIVPIDAKVISSALDSDLSDFEDAIQYHCWTRSKAKYLITRNVGDFPKHPGRIVTPTEFCHRS